MKTAIVACKTMEDELNSALEKTGCGYPVIWLDSGLHNVPKRLQTAVQEAIDGADADRVLLALGFCGNALAGVEAGKAELILPRVDDCISLLLGSVRRRLEITDRYAAYFFTEGWLRGERNIWVEHLHMLEKYGEEVTEALEEDMFGHYRTLGLLDCGEKPVEPLIEHTKMIADALHLEQKVIPASVDYLRELLTGPWPEERFLRVSPGGRIELSAMTLPKDEEAPRT